VYVYVQTSASICDPQRSRPVNKLSFLILGNWVYICICVCVCVRACVRVDFFYRILILWYVIEGMYQSAYKMEHHIHRSESSFTYSRQNIKGCELINEVTHYHTILISKHCKFMFVNFIYSLTCIPFV